MWKKINFLILSLQILICFIGTFYKHIAFGWGLGDLLWYGIMYLLLIIHLILTFRYRIEQPRDSKTKLLQNNNMPIYYANYKLKNDKLENIEFGFEYP